MLTTVHCAMDARDQAALGRAGLNRVEPLIDGLLRETIKRKGDQTVHVIDASDGERYYLKRSASPSLRRALSALRRGRRPHTESYREYLAARSLEDAGFRVMRVVMAGERRVLGLWPTRGFLLAREVPGREIGAVFGSVGPERTMLLWRAMGRLLARLHNAGFYHALRLHDLFVVDGAVDDDGVPDLTMIDPDFKGAPPQARRFSIGSGVESLAQSAYLFLRCGHRALPAHLRALLREYRATMRRLRGLRIRIAASVDAAVRGRFWRHYDQPSTAKLFDDAPARDDALHAPLARLFAPLQRAAAASAGVAPPAPANPRSSANPAVSPKAAPSGGSRRGDTRRGRSSRSRR